MPGSVIVLGITGRGQCPMGDRRRGEGHYVRYCGFCVCVNQFPNSQLHTYLLGLQEKTMSILHYIGQLSCYFLIVHPNSYNNCNR